jgi:hypothetical protein
VGKESYLLPPSIPDLHGYFLMPSARIRPSNMLELGLSAPLPSAGTNRSARIDTSFNTFDRGSFKRSGKP